MSDYSTIAALVGLKVRRSKSSNSFLLNNEAITRPGVPFGEEVFQNVLMLERRRAERSRRPFVLMLINADKHSQPKGDVLQQAVPLLISITRESDLIGWYRDSATVGIIFTELAEGEKATIAGTLLQKVESALQEGLGGARFSRISISVHVFPEDWESGNSDWIGDSKLYPDLRSSKRKKHVQFKLKRAIDIAGSAAILLVTFPFLALIALAIKLTSEGPVLFEQERLGQFGARFKCLKFRTMHTNCDPKIHQE